MSQQIARPGLRLLRRSGLVGLLALACVSPGAPPREYRFVEPSDPDNPWVGKVEEWQERTRDERQDAPLVAPEGATPVVGWLHGKLEEFERGEKRVLLERIHAWTQVQARQHYLVEEDTDPARDHWPTFAELIATNGDDCDGLDLISYRLMRSFGFEREEVWRAIIRRDRDGIFHMVTLWFESSDDPWVVDATGAASRTLRPLSRLEGWTPLIVFNDRDRLAVVERR
ncbi:MAG: hypothetical protein JRG76_02580 [Deltaproteobacteria bacterium]|nr:hypothetical protein [Deltaproteobacteria bacterium]MBW2413374.1 hypothetical protein [Deltaproteobacteria bacterium]